MVRRAKVGEYRTVVPKKGVFIHVKKTKRGVTKAIRLRRTKARVKATGKPRVQRIISKPTLKKVGKLGRQWSVRAKLKKKTPTVTIHSPDKLSLESFLKNHGYRFKKK